jgi:hypothetical protein
MNVPLMELLIHFDCAVNIEKYADYLRLILDQLILWGGGGVGGGGGGGGVGGGGVIVPNPFKAKLCLKYVKVCR